MDAQSSSPSSFKVLMLPWLAYGHISPYFELAMKLITTTNKNFHIYLCSTSATLNSFKQSAAKNQLHRHFSTTSIEFVELQLPPLPDLPPHRHTTSGLPRHLVPVLKNALDMAGPCFSTILRALKPDLLIYDFLQPWAPALAASELNIPAVEFLSTSAAMSCFALHSFKNPFLEFPFSINLRDDDKIKLTQLLEFLSKDARGQNPVVECFERSFKVILINSFGEIEGKYIDYFSVLTGKKIVPVGPLVLDPIQDQEADSEMEITDWLNKKEESSVVFVSFGSEFYMSREETEEVAHGLEQSSVGFIWVVRFPSGEDTKLEEVWVDGFLEKVKERGMVVRDWAPQRKILAHSSVGGFVSHCGWGSVMESLKFGVPVIAVPVGSDQVINAKVVEEVGVGVEVMRDGNGKLSGEEVARVIKKVVVEEAGEVVRKRAREFCEKIRKKAEEEDRDGVVEELVRLCVS